MNDHAKKARTVRRFKQKTVKKYLFVYGFLIYPIILFSIFYVYVNIGSFVLAFQKIDIRGARTFVGIDNFKLFIGGLLESGDLLNISLINSLKMFIINLSVCMPLYILFSYVLFKKVAGSGVIRVLVMMPAIISSFIFCLVFRNFAGAPLQVIMQDLGYANFPNLVDDANYAFGTSLFYMIWISFSANLIVYPNAMRSIDPSIFESAQIDGMSTMFQELRYIILPLIYPTITTFLILGVSTILSTSGPLLIFYVYNAPAKVYNMGYYMFVKIASNIGNPVGYPEIAAGGMIMTAIVGPLTLLVKRFFDKKSPIES